MSVSLISYGIILHHFFLLPFHCERPFGQEREQNHSYQTKRRSWRPGRLHCGLGLDVSARHKGQQQWQTNWDIPMVCLLSTASFKNDTDAIMWAVMARGCRAQLMLWVEFLWCKVFWLLLWLGKWVFKKLGLDENHICLASGLWILRKRYDLWEYIASG